MHSSFKILFTKLLLVVLSLSSLLSAGAPDTLWTKQYGYGPGEACGFAVQQTSDHGFIITGNFEPSVGGQQYTHDVYIVRTDSTGDTLWTKKYGGEDLEEGYSVLQTDDGGFIIAGHTFSIGNGEIYLLRTDSNGDTLWTKTYGGTDAESGFSICETNDGKFIIAGKTESFGQGSLDAYLLKVDSNGDTVWTKTFGGFEDDEASSVRLTSDGGFIIAGTTESSGAGGCDVYVIRTDSSGDTVWTRTYGGSEDDEGRTAFQTDDEGFFILGNTMSYGAGQFDVYLIRTDSIGDTVWTKTYGGVENDEGRSAQMVNDGGFIIAGTLENFTTQDRDIYVLRTDSNGDTIWTKTYGGADGESGYAIRQTADGGYIIAGSIGPSGNESNVYLIRLDKEATGILGEIPSHFIKPDDFIVTHNHANNHISIRYTIPYTGSVTLEAYDIKGKLLKKLVDTVLPEGSYSVKWGAERGDNTLTAGGVYFLTLCVNGAVVSEKVTIIR